MSYFGTREQAKSDAEAASITPDRAKATSPVRDGGSEAGGAPLAGTTEFTHARTRVPNQGMGMRREFPTEGVGGKK